VRLDDLNPFFHVLKKYLVIQKSYSPKANPDRMILKLDIILGRWYLSATTAKAPESSDGD
jgi:hypothetical protein